MSKKDTTKPATSGASQSPETPRSDEAQASSTPLAPEFDRRKAKTITPARRHRDTAKTAAWEQDGYYFTATGQPIAEITDPAADLADATPATPPNPQSNI